MEGAAGHSGEEEEEEAVAESAGAISSISRPRGRSFARAPGREISNEAGRWISGTRALRAGRTGVCWQEVVCFVSVRTTEFACTVVSELCILQDLLKK